MMRSDERLIYFPRAASFLGVCKNAVTRFVFEGRLPQPDEYARFRREDLERLKVELEKEKAATKPDNDD